MLTAAELKSLLRLHQLRLTKRLGQNHLVDARSIGRIIERCALSRADTVVEIGAGLGALTEPLAERVGQVIALEVDRAIGALLRERMQRWPNVTVRCEDALKFPWASMREVTVIGAIPYHITSAIFVSLCEARQAIRKAVLIVQEEVGERLLAAPATKAYGRLSVLGQYCWSIRKLLDVSRHAFYPQPAVDSVCLEFARRSGAAVRVGNEAMFFAVVKAAFSQRRKTLANCLCGRGGVGLARPAAEALISQAGLSPGVRGEQLSIEQFAALARALGSRASGPGKNGYPDG